MSNSLYYGEIAAKISAHLYQNPEQIMQLDLLMNSEAENDGDSIWTVCADAARVFDTLEDLSGEHYVDWHKALNSYADELLEHLLSGDLPTIIDMISMASLSILGTV